MWRPTPTQAQWVERIKRFCRAWDAINLSILALILAVVIWTAFRP